MPSVAQHLAKQETAKLVDAVDKKCFVPLACTMSLCGFFPWSSFPVKLASFASIGRVMKVLQEVPPSP